MANMLVNSTGVRGSTYYNTAGSTLTVDGTVLTSPKVKGGAAAGLGADKSLLDNVKSNRPTSIFGGGRVYRGLGNGAASWATGAFYCSASESGGYLGFLTTEGTTHPWAVGDLVSVRPSGAVAPQASGNYIYGVQTIAIAGTNGFSTSFKYDASANGMKAVVSRLVQDTTTKFATNNQVIAARITTKLYGESNNALLTAGNKVGRGSTHQVVSVRTQRTMSALRAGSYNRYTGKWVAVPTVANDFATSTFSFGGVTLSDTAANMIPYKNGSYAGYLTYKINEASAPNRQVNTRTYKVKT